MLAAKLYRSCTVQAIKSIVRDYVFDAKSLWTVETASIGSRHAGR
ncbi:hypothetical protein L284_21040 [Novosphingobium lindaniclasticum LE124]|uniref:Uncharacterized protein n=1 Tax=Novosphingobium lindaniclasticum LE124 TaxID=1096930 RepID=T0GX88_9SPHN|nr:hypothetical protein L284_21040 [Novosphingobium lindaniclasticum LE124]